MMWGTALEIKATRRENSPNTTILHFEQNQYQELDISSFDRNMVMIYTQRA
jgi:hypothetical protein